MLEGMRMSPRMKSMKYAR